MKDLKIKWLPETFAIVSLTMVTPQPPLTGKQSQFDGCRSVATAAGTKIIVISGEKELKADVSTATP